MSLANIIALVSSANVDPTTTSDYIEEAAPTVTSIVRNAPNGEQAAPIHNSPRPVIVRPTFDKLDAKSFLMTLRRVKTRDESIAAIVAYTGHAWERVASNFGNADQEARAMAQRELRGVNTAGPSRAEQRSAARSAAGFVAGMPKPQQRLVLDLQARAVSLAESRDNAKSDAEREQYQKLLNATNAALAELGF